MATARRNNNQPPEFNVKLFPKQAIVFSTPANEILFGGAAGGGKSFLMRVAAIIWCMQIPGLQVYLFRRTFSDLTYNHLEGPTSFLMLLSAFIDSGWVKWNKSDYTLTFWNGAAIHLCHCQRDADRFNYLGAEIHVLLIDELGLMTPIIYKFLRARVRMVGMTIPTNVFGTFPKILCGSNPGGPCHSFMKSNWVDIRPAMEIWQAPANDGGMMRQFIPAKISDNPALEEGDPLYRQRLMGLGDPAMVQAMLDGDFSVVAGGMFDDVYNPNVHVLAPFLIPPSWRVNRSFDFGTARPFSVGWWAEADGTQVRLANNNTKTFPRGSVIQIGEWYGWNGNEDEGLRYTPKQIAKGIISREKASNIARIHPGPADNSIWDADAHGKSVSDTMSTHGVNWEHSDKRPGSRKAGWTMMRTMMQAATEYPQTEPGLWFFKNCTHSIRLVPIAVRSLIDPDDVAKGFEDHALDMIRYRVLQSDLRARPSSFRAF